MDEYFKHLLAKKVTNLTEGITRYSSPTNVIKNCIFMVVATLIKELWDNKGKKDLYELQCLLIELDKKYLDIIDIFNTAKTKEELNTNLRKLFY